MDNFSEAFEKARTVIKNQKFEDSWQKFLKNEAKISELFEESGPNNTKADALEKIRNKLKSMSRGAVGAFFLGGGVADTIIKASKNGTENGKDAERAATLKMLRHLYLSSQRGAQDVWTYAGTKAFAKWVYDEITGDEKAYKYKLGKDTEVYSKGDRKMMCEALALALEWSLFAVTKLGSGDETTKAVVKRWFGDENTTDAQITTAIVTLRNGFQKIANVANSNKLIFSDDPIDRSNGGWKDWAFVYNAEKLNVVYLQGAFLKAGNSGKLWMCALTIIHELSHKVVGTKDYRYDNDGLKPSTTSLPHGKAIDNADSWAYFAVDLKGKVSNSDKLRVLV